ETNLYLKLIYHSLETLRSAAWFAFLIHLLHPLKKSQAGISNTLRFIIPGVSIYVVLVLSLDFLPIFYSTLPHNLNLSITGHIGLAIIGLVLIEQLFRNTRPEQRWAIKFLFIGIGGIFAYDFFLYSDALLFKRIDPNLWTARGFISALIVPLLAVTASRNPSWSLNIFVSRKIIFHSVTVFGAGLYLLVMSAVGYYIKFYGGDWGTAAQFIFLFLSLILLAALLFSGQMRARLKLFLNKHFYKNKYEYREEWLRLLKTISVKHPDAGLHETSIRAMASIVDSPGGQLWLIRDTQRYLCVETWSMNRVDEIESRHSSLIRFLEQSDYVINLLEYDSEPEQYAGLALPQWMEKSDRAWLIVPLRHHDELFGFMVLANPHTPRQINWEDRDFLKAVGQQLASYLSLFEASEALAEARQFD
ncbi:MAG: PEP-CTERM system histidine kinase PrsK, partial [Gammaproteobacteria bacterium]|nr:PEP-CTERM system histidine kinase PrsK [Gammaproteobacteria bacterium]